MRSDKAVLKALEASQINAEIAKLKYFAGDEAETAEERLEIAQAMEKCTFELQGLAAEVVARLEAELAQEKEREEQEAATLVAEASG